jgi:hypothetical protein
MVGLQGSLSLGTTDVMLAACAKLTSVPEAGNFDPKS